MSIVLAGGGEGPGIDAALERFAGEAVARAGGGRPARVAVVAVGHRREPDENAAAWAAKLAVPGPGRGAVDARPVIGRTAPDGTIALPVTLDDLLGVDGVLVAGGETPAYLAAVAAVATDVRRLVSEGVPYFGFSAGAAIAADQALVGGWRVGGVAVCPEAAGEGLDEVTVEAGLGLIDLAIDAHAAQWGTIGRALAAVESGLVDRALALDEDTALVVAEGALEIIGTGSVWQLQTGDAGVAVSTGRAG